MEATGPLQQGKAVKEEHNPHKDLAPRQVQSITLNILKGRPDLDPDLFSLPMNMIQV